MSYALSRNCINLYSQCSFYCARSRSCAFVCPSLAFNSQRFLVSLDHFIAYSFSRKLRYTLNIRREKHENYIRKLFSIIPFKVSRLSPSSRCEQSTSLQIANKLSLFYCCLTKHLHSVLNYKNIYENEIETFQSLPRYNFFALNFRRGFETGCAEYTKSETVSSSTHGETINYFLLNQFKMSTLYLRKVCKEIFYTKSRMSHCVALLREHSRAQFALSVTVSGFSRQASTSNRLIYFAINKTNQFFFG